MILFDNVKRQLEEEKPFVIYRKPNEKVVVSLRQHTKERFEVVDFSEEGFVFAPFSEGLRLYIPISESTIETSIYDFIEVGESQNKVEQASEMDKQHFERLVQCCIDAIGANKFQKVVPSRKESIAVNHIDIIGIFQRILNVYPTAFCSLFYHPEIGVWIGATPETLLKIKGDTLYTMALAGTQVNHLKEEVVWGQKEKEEQIFVTQFIHDSLAPLVTDISLSPVYTRRAAKVMHICTDITAKLGQTSVKTIVDVLHPTPAVCGLPKVAARIFLEKEEGYDRKYYAGYIGELNCDVTSGLDQGIDLYVNLRCMEVTGDVINMYLGCGVTIDSDPKSEFVETVNKSSTMKMVL